MSQQKKLEKVLDLLLSEDSEQASELLHQIIVEKSRSIYESIVDEEMEEEDSKEDIDESDEVGGEPNKDFTDEIASDEQDIDADEHNDGEAGYDDDADDEFDDEFDGEEEGEGTTEERVEDLESQLADLRAEFDALMGEELQEPNHADLAGEFDDEEDFSDNDEIGGNEFGADEMDEVAMFEKSKKAKLNKAPQKKDLKKGKKVDEETKFLNTVADTGQRGTAKLVGTGKDTPLGAEQTKSSFTNIPPRKDYGGKPTKFGNGTGGEYGKYSGESVKDDTPTDNVNVKPKNSSTKADTTPKYTGGKSAGEGFNKSPLSKKP
jgi:hypothetical protein